MKLTWIRDPYAILQVFGLFIVNGRWREYPQDQAIIVEQIGGKENWNKMLPITLWVYEDLLDFILEV